MEYLPGRSLKTIVREQGPLDPATAIDIVIQILRAARFAHRRGVDPPRPEAAQRDPRRGGPRARDRLRHRPRRRLGHDADGLDHGHRAVPLARAGAGHAVSAASDLYSVGIILYELLTGVVPFDGETAVAIALKQVSAQPRPPSEVNPAVPPALDAIVLRALAKDPAQRYADADEFIAALARERQALPALRRRCSPRAAGRARLERGVAP